MDPVLFLDKVSLQYDGLVVLDGIDLVVNRGDFVGIIGPNGAGKTSLLRLALGLQSPTSGTVHLFGTPLSQFRQRYRIAYLSQRATHFDPRFPITVEEVVGMGRTPRLPLFGRFRTRDREAVERALQRVGLIHKRKALVGNLSGGEQQRTLIARALTGEPDLMALDEPTTAVDVAETERFYDLLQELNQGLGLTIILVSHDIATVTDRANVLACLNKRLFFHGAPASLLQSERFPQLLRELYGGHARFLIHDHRGGL